MHVYLVYRKKKFIVKSHLLSTNNKKNLLENYGNFTMKSAHTIPIKYILYILWFAKEYVFFFNVFRKKIPKTTTTKNLNHDNVDSIVI